MLVKLNASLVKNIKNYRILSYVEVKAAVTKLWFSFCFWLICWGEEIFFCWWHVFSFMISVIKFPEVFFKT